MTSRARFASTPASVPTISILGRFTVSAADGNAVQWRSRKARQLLKILVARRGLPIAREALMHLLWPDEAPERLRNRFSVALSTVRRALDPLKAADHDEFLLTTDALIQLRGERIDIDVERFVTVASEALSDEPFTHARAERILAALEMHPAELLREDADEPWAQQLQREVHTTFFTAAHALADAAAAAGDELTRMHCCRRILSMDDYDQRAHEGLVDALTKLGAHGQAMAARATFEQRMRELDISILPTTEPSLPVRANAPMDLRAASP